MGFDDDPVHGPAGNAHHFHQAGFSNQATETVTGAQLLMGDSEETAWWQQRQRWLLLRWA
eukprot:11051269-Ditylum_brightwellii.AAC.1